MAEPPRRNWVRGFGLVAGPLLALVAFALTDGAQIDTATGVIPFSPAGRATLGLMVWMATWWLTEAIEVPATALLPLAVLPLVTLSAFADAGAAIKAAASPYADPFIALFLGGFVLALSMERWGLHRRIALVTLRIVGTRPRQMVAGFMAITAIMSMWVSNTATTVMMLPIALSVIALLPHAPGDAGRPNLARCLLLGIAYAASVGGIGTLIGTPPNLLLAGFIKSEYGVEISFSRWLLVGLPLVAVFVPIIWIVLTRVVFPIQPAPIEGAHALIEDAHNELGPMKPGEWVTFIVFMLTAMAWITRPLLVTITIGGAHPFAGLTDPGIAIVAALALFVIPVDTRLRTFTMNWQSAERVPWGILVLFGGGLSLAAAVKTHGVAEYLGGHAGVLAGWPSLLIVILVTAGVIFLTELTSNTATTATLLPILASIAPTLGIEPTLLLVAAAVAASCAFMMPVATPPNAIVFGSGHITIPEMCRAGWWLNLIGIALVTALAYFVAVPVLR